MINYSEITFVITTFKSEKIIFNCLSELPEISPKIVIENSRNFHLQDELKKNFQNLECLVMEENIGYGRANNIGILKSKTNYIFIINPDTFLSKKNLDLFLSKIKKENFSIASVLENHDQKDSSFNGKEIIDVDYVKGFAMLLNKKYLFGISFDENFFLYLEEIDLCLNIKKKGGRIILVNVKINHFGGNSHNDEEDFEMEKSRNWHWMWSKFYFAKKHHGFTIALIKTIPNFVTILIKYLFYMLIFNRKKKIIYSMRLLGLLNSLFLRKSFYRPYSKIN
ncbi:glycosyltransferase family 2 protein [Candidatus Pelagibacter sp. HIMB1509]|uniref:glycosyltransferase family 2 protein n=1 Tax=Candidatus Pelagibacter sp. HIMB1509 TaxID=3413339 RepID=UPI003F845B93